MMSWHVIGGWQMRRGECGAWGEGNERAWYGYDDRVRWRDAGGRWKDGALFDPKLSEGDDGECAMVQTVNEEANKNHLNQVATAIVESVSSTARTVKTATYATLRGISSIWVL